MKIVMGLGNPGSEYATTRHNVGFRVLDFLATRIKASPFQSQWQGQAAEAQVGSEAVWLLKPQTYMNLSGESLAEGLDAIEDPSVEVLVITDDVALPLGRLRCRDRGSCGGHNGLASIEMALATTEYARLRVGVAPAKDEVIGGEELIEYVLGSFGEDEEKVLKTVIPVVADAAQVWIENGTETCQQAFNGWQPLAEEANVDIDVDLKMEE